MIIVASYPSGVLPLTRSTTLTIARIINKDVEQVGMKAIKSRRLGEQAWEAVMRRFDGAGEKHEIAIEVHDLPGEPRKRMRRKTNERLA